MWPYVTDIGDIYRSVTAGWTPDQNISDLRVVDAIWRKHEHVRTLVYCKFFRPFEGTKEFRSRIKSSCGLEHAKKSHRQITRHESVAKFFRIVVEKFLDAE